jgi:hypothetical protein
MVTSRVKPRGPFYACKHARVFVDISGRNSGQDGGCYLAFASVTYQASCQAILLEIRVFQGFFTHKFNKALP